MHYNWVEEIWTKTFLHHVVDIVDSALTTQKRKLHTAPVARQKRDILSGASANCLLALKTMKSNIVEYVQSSRALYL